MQLLGRLSERGPTQTPNDGLNAEPLPIPLWFVFGRLKGAMQHPVLNQPFSILRLQEHLTHKTRSPESRA